jgi:hypothetical protein
MFLGAVEKEEPYHYSEKIIVGNLKVEGDS